MANKKDISWWVSVIGGILGVAGAVAAPFIYFEGRIDQIEQVVVQIDENHPTHDELKELAEELAQFGLEVQANKLKIQVLDRLSDIPFFD